MDYLTMPLYGIIAGLLASIPLGPIGVLCIQRTLSDSRRSGFFSGLGAATADTTFAALAIFALGWITGFIEKYQLWVEAFGGLLIFGFGLSMFLKKVVRSTSLKQNQGKKRHLMNYISVLFLTLPNPAYFFVFVTIFATLGVGSMDPNTTQKWLIVAGAFIGAASWWFTLTSIVSLLRKKFTMRTMMWLNKISGAVIALLGAYAVLAVVYQLIDALIKSGSL